MDSKGYTLSSLSPVVLLMGPTAAGKTAIAMRLADAFDVALISVDSAQVYRGLNIGSAKPDAATLLRYPHALIDIRDPESTYSAADFVTECEAAIQRAAEAGRLPVLVGGTVMYFRALIYGLDRLPAADPELRSVIQAQARTDGWQTLHAELERSDPVAASSIRLADPQRLMRAVEILRLSGYGPSHWQRRNRIARLPTLRLVVTASDRSVLHQRIEQRLAQMEEQGFLSEVEGLRRRAGLTIDHPSMKSVGYRQAWQHLEGMYDRQEWFRRAAAATRQLAKRQLTGLRQMSTSLWYDADTSTTINRIFRHVQGFLKQGEDFDLAVGERNKPGRTVSDSGQSTQQLPMTHTKE